MCMATPLPCFVAARALGASPPQAINWSVAQGVLIAGICVWLLMKGDAERAVRAGRRAVVVAAFPRFAVLWFVFFVFIYFWLNFVPIFLGWLS